MGLLFEKAHIDYIKSYVEDAKLLINLATQHKKRCFLFVVAVNSVVYFQNRVNREL